MEKNLSLQTAFGCQSSLEVVTNDIFAVWWDAKFDHRSDADIIFRHLKEVRQDCLNNLGMEDPPNPKAGFYYNVYIHHGDQDNFPSEWGNGQGTDKYQLPFLTLPVGVHISESNLYHEGFHIFQYQANSTGFAYQGDSQWYVEASAQWYMCQNQPQKIDAFVEAGAIVSNPHLSLWHSFSNQAKGDPTDWLYQVRQYGMHTYLYYLTNVENVSPDLITNGFYQGIDISPQEYHYRQIGADRLRKYFSDWAAHNTGDLDYLNTEQITRSKLEVKNVADPQNLHPYVRSYDNPNQAKNWISPPELFKPRGWAYNVIRIKNCRVGTYKCELKGDLVGSEGANSHFEGRIVVSSETQKEYKRINMVDAISGNGIVRVTSDCSDLFLVVTSVPENFCGTQNYGYQAKIETDSLT